MAGDVAGVLFPPPLLIAAAKGLNPAVGVVSSSPGSRLKPPRPPNELDEGDVAGLFPVIALRKLDVVSVGLVLLPAPKPPKVGAGFEAGAVGS